MRCSVFIAYSLDGYIARKDGSIDWLTPSGATGISEDYGYRLFMDSVDAVIIGRITYELALTFGEWPYGSRQVFVLSKDYPPEGTPLQHTALGMSAAPQVLVQQLFQHGIRRVYVDGGKTIQSFLRDRLINDLTITRVPILLGEGIPLFGFLGSELSLQHVETRSFKNGFVQSTYEIRTDG